MNRAVCTLFEPAELHLSPHHILTAFSVLNGVIINSLYVRSVLQGLLCLLDRCVCCWSMRNDDDDDDNDDDDDDDS